jgi:hypothetical protein
MMRSGQDAAKPAGDVGPGAVAAEEKKAKKRTGKAK